jgi:hypothetical protein
MRKKFLTILCAMSMFGMGALAQNAVLATGGDATSSTGNVSYSVGQIVYNYTASGDYSISEGVQQAYDISEVGIDNYPGITLSMSVYPNPTNHSVTLSIDPVINLEQTECVIYDLNGKVISQTPIHDSKTQINLESLAPSIYFFNVINNQKTIKIFKVIKQ